MGFQKIFKNWTKLIVVLLLGTMILPYFSLGNIAKAYTVDIDSYKTAITNSSCIAFYAENCTADNENLGSTYSERSKTLNEWKKKISTASEETLYDQAQTISFACTSLEELSYEEYHDKVDSLNANDATRGCLAFLSITEPIDPAETQKNGNEIDRCPIDRDIPKISFWSLINSPIDNLLAVLPNLLKSILVFVIKIATRTLQLFIMPNNQATMLSFIGKLKANSGYSGYTIGNQFVVESWELMRDVANILIMLLIFVIALSIMLRRNEFGSYQALIYLVVVALLVNFSLVMCGMLIDISNYFTVFFLHNGGIENLECTLVTTIHNVSHIFIPHQSFWQNFLQTVVVNPLKTALWPLRLAVPGLGNTASNWITGGVSNALGLKQGLALGITVSSILGLIVAIVLCGQIIGLLIYVLVRILTLWFLSILSPVAMVLFVLPQTRGYFNEWWKRFSALLISLPALCAAMFFILRLMNQIAITANSTINNNGSNDGIATVIGYSVMIVILGQAMLAAASALNVENVGKMTTGVKNLVTGAVVGVAGTTWKEGKKRVFKSEGFRTMSEELTKNKNSWISGLGVRLNKMAKSTTQEDIKRGGQLASDLDDQAPSVIAREAQNLYRSKSPLTADKAAALGAFGKIIKGIQANDFQLDDIIKFYPDFLKDLAEIQGLKQFENESISSDIQKFLPYLKFDKARDANGNELKDANGNALYDSNSVKKVLLEFGSDKEKLNLTNQKSLFAFLENSRDENGELLIKSGLPTYIDAIKSSDERLRTVFKKSKIQDKDALIDMWNTALSNAGMNMDIFQAFKGPGLKSLANETTFGQLLGYISSTHKQQLNAAIKGTKRSKNKVNLPFDTFNNMVDSNLTNQGQATQLLSEILRELKDANDNQDFRKPQVDNFESFLTKIKTKGFFTSAEKALPQNEQNFLKLTEKVINLKNQSNVNAPNSVAWDTQRKQIESDLTDVIKNKVNVLPNIIDQLKKASVTIGGTQTLPNNVLTVVMSNIAPNLAPDQLKFVVKNIALADRTAILKQISEECKKMTPPKTLTTIFQNLNIENTKDRKDFDEEDKFNQSIYDAFV